MSNEVRDKVAELEGYTYYQKAKAWKHASRGLLVGPGGSAPHPIPDTLDACAAAWDKHAGASGWFWWRTCFEWLAQSGGPFIRVRETGTDAAAELRDRWALLGEVLKARGV